jgi:phosphatidylserine/phosphatidylglycerophosphate/cardiolipin synthase-like enzyme
MTLLQMAAGIATLVWATTATAQRAITPPPQAPHAASGNVQVAFTPWEDAEGMVIAAIREAQRQILVQAYVLTSRRIAAALIAARRRGVEVSVMMDREQAHADGSRVRELASAGIPVWLETRYAVAHNKVMIIDPTTRDPAVITGSFNWTAGA